MLSSLMPHLWLKVMPILLKYPISALKCTWWLVILWNMRGQFN